MKSVNEWRVHNCKCYVLTAKLIKIIQGFVKNETVKNQYLNHLLLGHTVQQWFSNWGTRVICDTLTKKL